MKLFAEPIVKVETFAVEDVITASGDPVNPGCPVELERD